VWKKGIMQFTLPVNAKAAGHTENLYRWRTEHNGKYYSNPLSEDGLKTRQGAVMVRG